DFDSTVPAHQAIPVALRLAAERIGRAVEPAWVATDTLGPDVASQLAEFAGVWCVPASPYRSLDGALAAIRHARERGVPFLGTCGGFQHALIEFARNVLRRPEADHAETNPGAVMPIVAPLACELVERSGRVEFAEGSRLRSIYGAAGAEE